MATDPRSDEWKHPDGNDDDTCKYCGADMKHSPCCGRVAGYGDTKESLRLEVLENDRLRQRVEELERVLNNTRADAQYRVDRLTTERDEARKALAEEKLAFLRAQAAYDEMANDINTHAPQEYISGYLKRMGIDIGPAVARVRQAINSNQALTRHADGRKEKTDDTGL